MQAARALKFDSSAIGVLAARAHAARAIDADTTAAVASPARALHAMLERAAESGFVQPSAPRGWHAPLRAVPLALGAAAVTALGTLALGLHLLA